MDSLTKLLNCYRDITLMFQNMSLKNMSRQKVSYPSIMLTHFSCHIEDKSFMSKAHLAELPVNPLVPLKLIALSPFPEF